MFASKPEVAQEQGHNSIYHADLKPEAVDQLTIDMRKRQIEIYQYIYISIDMCINIETDIYIYTYMCVCTYYKIYF